MGIAILYMVYVRKIYKVKLSVYLYWYVIVFELVDKIFKIGRRNGKGKKYKGLNKWI